MNTDRIQFKVLSAFMALMFLMNTVMANTSFADLVPSQSDQSASIEDSKKTPDSVMDASGDAWEEVVVDAAQEAEEPATPSLEDENHYANGQIKQYEEEIGGNLTRTIYYMEDGRQSKRVWKQAGKEYSEDIFEYFDNGKLKKISRDGKSYSEFDDNEKIIFQANSDGGYTTFNYFGVDMVSYNEYHANGNLKKTENVMTHERHEYDETGFQTFEWSGENSDPGKSYLLDGSGYWSGSKRYQYVWNPWYGQQAYLAEEKFWGGGFAYYWVGVASNNGLDAAVKIMDTGSSRAEYDMMGNMTSYLDRNSGTRTSYALIPTQGSIETRNAVLEESYKDGSWMRNEYWEYSNVWQGLLKQTTYSDGRVRDYFDPGVRNNNGGVKYRDTDAKGNWTDYNDWDQPVRSFDVASGDTKTYGASGAVDRIDHKDGSYTVFVGVPNWGNIRQRVHHAADGTVTEYHPDGVTRAKVTSAGADPTVDEFFANGKPMIHREADGSYIDYYENGSVKTNFKKDAGGVSITLEYREDGSLLTTRHETPTSSVVSQYDAEGVRLRTTTVNGDESWVQEWYADGQIKSHRITSDAAGRMNEDGSMAVIATHFNPDGSKRAEELSDGITILIYPEDGSEPLQFDTRWRRWKTVDNTLTTFAHREAARTLLEIEGYPASIRSLFDGPYFEIQEGSFTVASAVYVQYLIARTHAGAREGEPSYDPSLDVDGDGEISEADWGSIAEALSKLDLLRGGWNDYPVIRSIAFGANSAGADFVSAQASRVAQARLLMFGEDGFNGLGLDAQGYNRQGFHHETGLNRAGYDAAGNRRLYHPNNVLRLSFNAATGVTQEFRTNGTLERESTPDGSSRMFFENGRTSEIFDAPSGTRTRYHDVPTGPAAVQSVRRSDGSGEFYALDGLMTRRELAASDTLGAVAYDLDRFGRAVITEMANGDRILSGYVYPDTMDRSRILPDQIGRLTTEDIYRGGVRTKTFVYASAFTNNDPNRFDYQYARWIHIYDPADPSAPPTILDCNTSDCMEEFGGVRGGWGDATDVMATIGMIEVGAVGSSHSLAVAGVLGAMEDPITGISSNNLLTSTVHVDGVRDGWLDISGGASDHLKLATAIRQEADANRDVINLSVEISMDDIINAERQRQGKATVDADVLAAAAAIERLVMSDLQDAVDYARGVRNEATGKDYTHRQHRSIVVASAGNNDTGLSLLARVDGVVAVGAVDYAKRHAELSNSGAELDFVAAGLSVLTFARSGLRNWSGTSFAAPIVSATIAKLIGYARMRNSAMQITESFILSFLKNTVEDLGAAGHDQLFGDGLIRPMQALAGLRAWFGSILPQSQQS